jgi:hypothetical protein
LEADDHPLLLARGDGKDTRTQEAMSHPLDKGRVALAAHDLLVDAPRAVGGEDLAGDELPVDRELQVLKRGALREREEVVRLAESAAAIDEPLLHLVLQHAVGHGDAHVARGPHDLRRHRTRTPLEHAWRWRAPIERTGTREDAALRREDGRRDEERE